MRVILKTFLSALVALHLVAAGAAYAAPCKKCCCCKTEAGWQKDDSASAKLAEPTGRCCGVRSDGGTESATLNSNSTGLLQASSLAAGITGLAPSYLALKGGSPTPDYGHWGRWAFESPPVYKLTKTYLC